MKRTCRNGIIDFDAMNAFAPDSKGPFCQVAASGYGDAGLKPGAFLQTDDMGQVMHRDLAFKMLLDLCIRTGTDSVRYLYSEFVRSMSRDGFKPGLAIPEPGTLVRKLLDGFGVAGVCMPDIPCALERNFSVFHNHDMMGELRQKAAGDKRISDIVNVLDGYVYIEPGNGSFDKAMDAVTGLMSSMQADEIRLLSGLFYKAMACAPVQPFSMASVRPIVTHMAVAYHAPDAAPVTPENNDNMQAVGDDYGNEMWTEAEPESDVSFGGDDVPEEAGGDSWDGSLEDAVSDEAPEEFVEEPPSEPGTDDAPCDEDTAGDNEKAAPDDEDEAPVESETDPDANAGNTAWDSEDGESDTEPEAEAEPEPGTEPETDPEPETEPETDPGPVSPGVVPLSVSDLIGKDASYASGYLSDQYERELDAAPSEGLLEAMVASRANGTASPIDVLSETIHKVAETPSVGRNLREDMRDMAKAAREAAPGAELGTGSPDSRQ